MVFKYKHFYSTEDFEKWQQESERKINQISPVSNGFSGGFSQEELNEVDMGAAMDYGVFVVYSE